MNLESIIGYIGSITVAFLQLPQIIKTYKSKRADDLAWGMILLNMFSGFIWFSYGIITSKYPIIVANIFYFISNCTLVIMKIKYKINNSELNNPSTSNMLNTYSNPNTGPA